MLAIGILDPVTAAFCVDKEHSLVLELRFLNLIKAYPAPTADYVFSVC